MLIAMFFALKPYFNEFALAFENLNKCLVFIGLGVSFSTLQDTTKTQNNISKQVWENPWKGKAFIIALSVLILFLMIMGLIGYFSSINNQLKEISFGIIVLAIGCIGLLKSAIEMFENHRKDKNTPVSIL